MAKLRVLAMSYTLDGFTAGLNQRLDNPLGDNGGEMMGWLFPTRYFAKMQGKEGGETGVDNDMAEKGFANIGAWILGRNMFGPIRGDWPNEEWQGWWGDEPPYHCDAYVLTHHARKPLVMKGGTTFHFVTDGIESALQRAFESAKGKDVRLGGGASVVRQYLQARLIDDLHLAVRPVLLGSGESLFGGLNLRELGYECVEQIAGERATHVIIRKKN
jgi:dihydrofolate reductase